MDDGESPTNDLLLNVQDLLRADTCVERRTTHLTSSPDENENQLNGSKDETLKRSDNVMGIVAQDSINNNEGEDSGDYTPCFQEVESGKPSRSFSSDDMLIPEKCISGKRTSQQTNGSIRKDLAAKQGKTDITAADPAQNKDGNKTNANCPQKEPTETLQALFSLLREECEPMDSRVLPLCLHQIAETYFQDGEYEKAMKFIQLERLYHEQLLANLSSVQQQWEKKWKATASSSVLASKNSVKDLNNEELNKLAELCTSHQEPLVSRNKLICEKKYLCHETFTDLMVSGDLKERGAVASDSDNELWPGIRPKKENHHKERERSERFQPESCCMPKERASPQLAVRKDHMEEEQCSAESTLELPTQSTGTLGTPRSGCLSSTNASEDNGLQLREEQLSEDVAKIEATAEEARAECTSEPMVDTLVLTDTDYLPPDLTYTDENVQSERNLLRSKHCPVSSVISSTQLEGSIKNQQQQPTYGNESVQGRTASDIGENVHSERNVPEQANVAYAKVFEDQKEEAELEEGESEGPEDFFERFFNGSIKDREESLKYLGSQGDSGILPLEQSLYSLSEGYSPEESFSSLDELAKRIEIAETVPAEGLVSILKKRDDNEGKTLAQLQQRQSKRRVRFQEMEDTLDHEEVGGGSCILLILLCLATVFLSVGGTALYCTFGDTESPVCTDFAANMDFYCTRILQGLEELKKWISFS
ncbi:consortin [Tiliqua scincoides]|uniref:consortin n=1 Tax=Tiliqua scincoides TaxID=71010 RepID=UPI003461FABC